MSKKVKLSDHYGSFNKTGDVYEIRFERMLEHPVRQVWEAITEPEKLAMWLGEAKVNLQTEGDIHIQFQEMAIVGQILQLKNESLLEYTWTSQSFPGEISIVKFELFAEGNSKTRLVFTERLVSAPYLAGAGSGWHYILDTLQMVLENISIPAWSDDMRVEIFEQLSPKYKKIKEEKESGKTKPAPAATTAMLIRKPVAAVYEAMVNPAITSQFWFTKGSGRLDSGKDVKWEWGMYDVSAELCAHDIKKNKFISFNWPSGNKVTTVEWTFAPHGDDATFFSVKETGWDAADENLAEIVSGQTSGWTNVLAALKAYLEFDIVLPLILDRFPSGKPETADTSN